MPIDAPTQSEREKLQLALLYKEPGSVLGLILKFYTPDNLEEKWHAHVRSCLERELLNKAQVHTFGSVATGLALKDYSVDIYLEPREDDSSLAPVEVFLRLLHRSILFKEIRSIRRCRESVIQCKHIVSDKRVEISVSKPVAVYGTNFIGQLIKRDPRLQEMFLFLKIWARKLKLIGDDGMTSYCLYVLIIFSLQRKLEGPGFVDLQPSTTSPINVRGVNYAYDIDLIPRLRNETTTLQLLKGFFNFYKSVEFENIVVCPWLGCVLKKRFFYTYQAKRMALEGVENGQPSAFQLNRYMCVQDLWNMDLNVAKSVTLNKGKYLKQSIMLAAKAFRDPELLAQPVKLYDYLLFGLPDKVVPFVQEEEPELGREAVAEPDQLEDEPMASEQSEGEGGN